MSTRSIKLINFFILMTLLLSACGAIGSPTLEAVVETEIPVEPAATETELDLLAPEAAEQPVFGDEINAVLQACSALSLNQACQSQSGAITDLTAGQSFSLTSTSLGDYNVLVARLQAPGVDNDFGSLLVLAVGTVEVSFDEIFFGRDETNLNLPRLAFSSENGAEFQSGIVIINENEEDLLSIEVNGVGLTLGSTAVVTSQPNVELKVKMLTGTVTASANGETVSAAKGESVSVQMTEKSKPASAPQSSGVDDDLLTPLVPPKKPTTLEFTRENYHKFESAYHRCMNEDARQVYRLMYFANLLLNNPDLDRADRIREYLTPVRINEMKEMVRRCATFELIVTGRQQGSSALSWSTAVTGDVLKLQFDDQGKLVSQVEGELEVTEFFPDMPLPPGCTSTTETGNSILRVKESSTLKIYYNTMQIRLYFWPNPVTETLVMNCPSAPDVKIPLDWNTYFWYLHPDLLRQDNQSYLVQDWEYTGGEIYAEAFYLGRSGTIEDGVVTSDTTFTLLHTPQK